MRLLFIHGRSQGGRDPAAVEAEWLEALDKGLKKNGLARPAGLKIDLPFYGDLLDTFAAQFDLPVGNEVAAKGGGMDTEYAQFRAEIAEEMRQKAGISDAAVQGEMGPGPEEKGPQNWKWVQAIVRLIDRNTPDVSGLTIEKFLRDVYLYVRRAAVQRAIDKVVLAKLTDEPTVVVSHSLGTVVAYNVLRNAPHPLNIAALITVGSPLAIRAIRSSFTPLKNPMGKDRWYNAYDEQDIVALYPLDGANFAVDPGITNARVHNWTENRHGISGYLDDGPLAKVISASLK